MIENDIVFRPRLCARLFAFLAILASLVSPHSVVPAGALVCVSAALPANTTAAAASGVGARGPLGRAQHQRSCLRGALVTGEHT